jgi:hypothetical protein
MIVIAAMQKVVADSRMSPRDNEMLNDDLQRLRDRYRALHENCELVGQLAAERSSVLTFRKWQAPRLEDSRMGVTADSIGRVFEDRLGGTAL